MFNANIANLFNYGNFGIMNAYYAKIKGNVRRGFQGSYNSGGRNGSRNDIGMFFNTYPRGFPSGTGGFRRGHAMESNKST